MQLAANARHLVASDLPRAIESAKRIAPHREIVVSPLLRETMLDVPRWPTRMPAVAWEALAHLLWGYRVLRGMDTTNADRARAIETANWLAGLVADGSTAVVVTHGVFRRQVSIQLLARGWASTGRIGGYDNWSTWGFAHDTSS
jgi:broad specificity phosphatase PhoE